MSARKGTDRFTRPTRRKHQFKGVPVVPGIAMGTVHLKFRKTHVLSDRMLKEEEVERELELLNEAVRLSKEQLLVARSRVAEEVGELEATIFDTHIAILEDRSFLGKVKKSVEGDLKPVEVVVSVIVEGYYQAMSMVEDEHLKERAADIRDVGLRLLENIYGLKQQTRKLSEAIDREVPEGDIIFSRELLPSDIATLERRHVSGCVTEDGNGRGHCAVMLRALNVPTVMGVEGLASILRDGDFVIVDGSSGRVLVNPRGDVVKEYRSSLKDFNEYHRVLEAEVGKPSVTPDGVKVELLANISKASEIAPGMSFHMDGVGLYRTEFQLMASEKFPDEELLYETYREVVEEMDGRPITIRTMDIGTDKQLSYIKLPHEENHALGRRSIRLAFDLDDLQMIQLRAILRAAVHGDVRVMFPFITSVEDIRLAKRMLRQAMRQLDDSRKKYDEDISVGMMVEVPAAALSLDRYAREVDFVSVGTNDLVQYLCAADRNLSDVSAWYKGYNPGVLNCLKQLVETADANKVPLTVCGEMAGDPFYTLFLLGIGVKRLSMSSPQIPLVKKIVRSVDMAGARRIVDRALQYSSSSQIRHLFQDSVEQLLGRDLTAWTRKRD